jgi:hypothetical protein
MADILRLACSLSARAAARSYFVIRIFRPPHQSSTTSSGQPPDLRATDSEGSRRSGGLFPFLRRCLGYVERNELQLLGSLAVRRLELLDNDFVQVWRYTANGSSVSRSPDIQKTGAFYFFSALASRNGWAWARPVLPDLSPPLKHSTEGEIGFARRETRYGRLKVVI